MRFPMVVLGVLCAVVGVAAPLIGPILDGAAAAWAPELATGMRTTRDLAPLDWLPIVYAPLIALTAALAVWLQARLARAPARVVTWDCGYVRPTARMQYTASSFAQMLVGMFRWALRPHGDRPRATELFPAAARFETHVPDVILDNMLARGTQTTDRAIRWTRWVQRGSTNMYVLYILVTLVVLLIWKGGA
jgi:hydrogenase-4 component B